MVTIIFLRKVSASRQDLACTSTQICSALGHVHQKAWRTLSDVSSRRNVSSLAESFISRCNQSHLLGYTLVRMRSQCLKLKLNWQIPKRDYFVYNFMYGYKLAAEEIRVLVQAKPLPGAVHRPCVGKWVAISFHAINAILITVIDLKLAFLFQSLTLMALPVSKRISRLPRWWDSIDMRIRGTQQQHCVRRHERNLVKTMLVIDENTHVLIHSSVHRLMTSQTIHGACWSCKVGKLHTSADWFWEYNKRNMFILSCSHTGWLTCQNSLQRKKQTKNVLFAMQSIKWHTVANV